MLGTNKVITLWITSLLLNANKPAVPSWSQIKIGWADPKIISGLCSLQIYVIPYYIILLNLLTLVTMNNGTYLLLSILNYEHATYTVNVKVCKNPTRPIIIVI